MQELKPDRIVTESLVFPEGPRWRDGRLFVSDMGSHRVVAISPEGDVEPVVEVPESPSGLGWLPDGSLVMVSMNDRKLLRLEDGALVQHADLSQIFEHPANDMVVDSQGRAYVGNFGFSLLQGVAPVATSMALVQADGRVALAADDLVFPNGAVITPDGGRLIVAETWGFRLTSFAIAADGSLSDRQIFADLGKRTPDGIALDAQGAVWVACFEQAEFVRVEQGGSITARVPAIGRNALACMLGGEDLCTLFTLSVVDVEKMASGQSQGFIEAVRVDVPGAGLP